MTEKQKYEKASLVVAFFEDKDVIATSTVIIGPSDDWKGNVDVDGWT